MTPEMRLAQFLSGNEETQKIQSEVRGFSIEELEGLLKTGSVKTANGDMLQYFQDHPEKLKEKQERDRKKEESKEKKAFTVDHLKAGAGMAATGVAGYALGKHIGKKEKKSSSEPETNEASSSDIKAEMEKDEKLSPQDKIKKADAMGRELAHKEKVAVSFNQINEGTKIPGRLIKAYESVKEPVGRALKAVGGKVHGGVKALGSRINSINDPIVKGTAAGSLIGGVGGAVTGAILPDKDEMGNPQRGKTMLRRGIAGTLQGAATGAITGAMHKSSSVQKLQAVLEKDAAGLNMAGIGSMAKNFVGSMQSVGQKAMGAVKPMAQKAMGAIKPMVQNAASSGAVHNGISSLYGAAHKAGQMSMGARAGIGAGVGAAAGAAKGLVAPGRNAQGQQNGRLGSMARGAVGGAALGAGAGAVAPKALGMAGDAAHLARKKVLGLG